ncbi:MAG: hypothetical protein ABWZ25_04455 [Chitinophagaceae bacterium]
MKKRGTRFFIRQYNGLHFQHGGIGYIDIENILLAIGFHPVELPFSADLQWRRKPSRIYAMIREVLTMPRGSTVVFLYPVYANLNLVLLKLLRFRNVRLVCILADISGLKFGNHVLLRKEQIFFRSIPSFVVHNAAMKNWLLRFHPQAQASELQFFDFPVIVPEVERSISGVIVFAGNLEKSGFLQKLGQPGSSLAGLHFHLYGPGLRPGIETFPNVSYKGSFDPKQLPYNLEGSFGLIWDGDGLAEPEGDLGHYISLISQHKLSLYILCGLPVIIHELTGCAPLVLSAGIGLVINDLQELPEKIKALPKESYDLMRFKMRPIAEVISRGGNLPRALAELGT